MAREWVTRKRMSRRDQRMAIPVESLEDRRLLSGVAEAGDEPPLPVLTISPVTVTEGDSGTSFAVFRATLSEASENTVTAEYFTVEQTAAAGPDFSHASGTLVLLAGETDQTISIAIHGDVTPELNETFLLRFINPMYATLETTEVAATIENDDGPIPDIEAPDAATGLTATAGDGQVTLTWTTPVDPELAGVLIVRRPNLAPTGGPTTGYTFTVGQIFSGGIVVIHTGVGNSFVDTGLVNGTTYHYAAYTYNATGGYSPVARIAATPAAVIPPDTVAPAAKLAKLAGVKPGKTPYRFRVAYTDLGLVNAATIWNRDILITGPRKYKQWIRFVSKTPTGNAARIVATYQMTAPGKTWGPEDNGLYTLWSWPGQVTDASGNPNAKKKLGVLKVALKGTVAARPVAAAPIRAAQSEVRPAAAFAARPAARDGVFNTRTSILNDGQAESPL